MLLPALPFPVDRLSVFVQSRQPRGVHVDEVGPLLRMLVIDENLRLVEEAGETGVDAEPLGDLARMVSAARAPAIELSALSVQVAYVGGHLGDGGPVLAMYESVVHVYVNKQDIVHTR